MTAGDTLSEIWVSQPGSPSQRPPSCQLQVEIRDCMHLVMTIISHTSQSQVGDLSDKHEGNSPLRHRTSSCVSMHWLQDG